MSFDYKSAPTSSNGSAKAVGISYNYFQKFIYLGFFGMKETNFTIWK